MMSKLLLNNSRTSQPLWQPMAVLGHAHSKKLSPDIQRKAPVLKCVPIALSPVTSHHSKEHGCVLFALSLQIFYIHIYILIYVPSWAFLSPDWTVPDLSAFCFTGDAPASSSSSRALHRSLCSWSISLLYYRTQNGTQHCGCGFTRVE